MTEKDKTASNLTAFKEIAAAILGGIIIVLTLYLMWPLLTKTTPDIVAAQGIFSILGGWGGIIIGYYFGRLPSEKAADTANKVADTANQVANQANQATIIARQETETARQTISTTNEVKLRVISDCTNLLENTKISLQELSGHTTDSKAKKALSTTDLESVTNGIEEQIHKIESEIDRLKNIQ